MKSPEAGTTPAFPWKQAAIAALATGLYVSAFFIVGNFTMLTPESVYLVAAVLTVPIVIGVIAANAVLAVAGMRRHAGFASAFLIGLYLLLMLRAPILNSSAAVRDFREQLDGSAWALVHLAYFLALSTAIGFLFRRHNGKLAAILAVMTVAAVLPAFRASSVDEARRPDLKFLAEKLDRKPGIYLILADGLSSLAFMRGAGISALGLESRLRERGFRLYEDTFSNYHSTTDSMLSMLEMQHHYYRDSRKMAEVSESARQVIGGDNALVRLLKSNGYRTEYIHQGAYLLFQGCTADYCYPSNYEAYNYSGARSVLREILPRFVARKVRTEEWEVPPLGVIQREVANRLAANASSPAPLFQYIHIYAPGHASNSVIGRCDERAELGKYAKQVEDTVPAIESIIDEIILRDRGAVILLSGDHGPFISNRCERSVDIDTLGEYRDRVGVMTGVRWPDGYDGRFDAHIRTNVNLFRFVLAALIDGRNEALGGRVRDDVFVRGNDRVLKILDDGKILESPVEFPAGQGDSLDWEN